MAFPSIFIWMKYYRDYKMGFSSIFWMKLSLQSNSVNLLWACMNIQNNITLSLIGSLNTKVLELKEILKKKLQKAFNTLILFFQT
jgi:hypothetical protein